MTGAQFEEALEDHFALSAAEYVSEAQRLGLPPTIKGLHKISSNPEKSKHLETEAIEIFRLSVNFVNLRKETYTDRSRNHQVEFGTTVEDPYRRDATINSILQSK